MDTETEKQPDKAPETQLATRLPREIRVVEDSGPLAYLMDSAKFEHTFRLASAMAGASLIPEHLRWDKRRGDYTYEQIKCNCFRIINQALRWGVDPWSIIDDSFVTGGKLGYQGKVIAALVNTRAPLKQRLKDRYTGTKGKDDYTITVSGTFVGEDEPREVSLSVGEAKTENQMWRSDPSQKLWYSAVVRWARKYCPELVVGVFTEDDAERMDAWRAQAAKEVKAGPARTAAPDFSPPAEEKKAKAKELSSPSKAEAEISELAAQEVVDDQRRQGKTLVEVFSEEKRQAEKAAGKKVSMQPHEHLVKSPTNTTIEEGILPWDESK